MANKGKTLYLKIFVSESKIDLDKTGLFMGSYEHSYPHAGNDFMHIYGEYVPSVGDTVIVFDSAKELRSYNLLAEPTLNVVKAGDRDNFGKQNSKVSVNWAVDGVIGDVNTARIESLDNQHRWIYVFDSDVGIVEEVHAMITMESETKGNGVQSYTLQASETGARSQIYKKKLLPPWPVT